MRAGFPYILFMRNVHITNAARKALQKIAKPAQAKIITAIDGLGNWPDVRNVKALVNRNDYRLRVGDYRVIFEVEGEDLTITEVKKRDERTY